MRNGVRVIAEGVGYRAIEVEVIEYEGSLRKAKHSVELFGNNVVKMTGEDIAKENEVAVQC